MAEEESHDWAKSRSPGVAFEPDLAARRLTVTAVRPQCDVDFSVRASPLLRHGREVDVARPTAVTVVAVRLEGDAR